MSTYAFDPGVGPTVELAELRVPMVIGDLLLGTGAAAPGLLSIGPAGQILTSVGGTATWAAAGAPGAHKDSHKSGGSDAFASTDLLEAVVKRLQTTTGPTTLTVGAVADGEFLKRSGSSIIGATVTSEWTDPGAFIHPTEVGDNVIIGAATEGAATHVFDADGSTIKRMTTNVIGLDISSSGRTTAIGIKLFETNNAITIADLLSINETTTNATANRTVGKMMLIESVRNVTSGVVADSWNSVEIKRNSQQAGGTYTVTGVVLTVSNSATGTITDTSTVLRISQGSQSTGQLIHCNLGPDDVFNLTATGLVINDAGLDRDTRIESDTDPNLLFLEGSSNRIAIGTGTTDTSKVTIVNTLSTDKALVLQAAVGQTGGLMQFNNSAGAFRTFFDKDSRPVFNPLGNAGSPKPFSGLPSFTTYVREDANGAGRLTVHNDNAGSGAFSSLMFANNTTSAAGAGVADIFLHSSTRTGFAGANSLNIIIFSLGDLGLGVDSVGLRFNSSNNIGIGANISSPLGQLSVTNDTAADKAFVVRGAASQADDYVDIQDSAGTTLVRIDSSGDLQLRNGTTTLDGAIAFDRTNEDLSIGDAAASQIVHVGAWKTWTPAFTGFSSDPTVDAARFSQVGKSIVARLSTSGGTSNATTFTVTLPVVASSTVIQESLIAVLTDGGGVMTTPGLLRTRTGSTTADLYIDSDQQGWVGSSAKNATFVITYETN